MKQAGSNATADGDAAGTTRLRAWVARRCSPRSTMILMMFGTTAVGSIASYLLLHAGVTHFAIRYALAVMASYATLVALIGLWCRYEVRRLEKGDTPSGRRGTRSNLADGDGIDVLQGSGGGSGSGSGSSGPAGGGGGSGGAGASSSFDDAATPGNAPSTSFIRSSSGGGGRSSGGGGGRSSGGGSGGGGFSLDLDGDEVLVVLLVVAAVAVALFAAGYVVWIAPDFLGDVLASTVAGAGISHHVTRHEPGWVGLVVRRTIWPALAVLAMFTVAGFALQSYAPGARTLHGAWQHHLARHAEQGQ